MALERANENEIVATTDAGKRERETANEKNC